MNPSHFPFLCRPCCRQYLQVLFNTSEGAQRVTRMVAIGSTIRLARVNERSKVSTVEFKEQKIEAEREGERENINQIFLFRMSDSKPNGNGRYSESEAAVTLSKMKSSNSFSPSFILPWPPSSHVPSLIELRERRRFHSRIPPPTPLAHQLSSTSVLTSAAAQRDHQV